MEKSTNMACPGTLKRLRCLKMKKITLESKYVWINASNEAPWQTFSVSAHKNEGRPKSLSLSSRSYFKLEEKGGQKSPKCKGGLTKDRCWIFNLHLKPMPFQ
ncbi:hypothetical protein N665_3646s0001 [Sinapis alba]|nr:hypothetical protein N665_3646s0001 [Sinapis alba]